jgi:hypothetical protein
MSKDSTQSAPGTRGARAAAAAAGVLGVFVLLVAPCSAQVAAGSPASTHTFRARPRMTTTATTPPSTEADNRHPRLHRPRVRQGAR